MNKLMTEREIESLAAERVRQAGDVAKSDGTYLSALIVAVQSKLGAKRGKRPATDAQLAALDETHGVYYAAVLRGVTTPDIAIEAHVEHGEAMRRTRERSRRATFARSAKSTLATWCKAGGDLRALDADKVSKTELRTSAQAADEPEGSAEQRSLRRATERIAKVIAQTARGSPANARAWLEGIIAELTEKLEEIPDDAERHADSTVVTRTRVGAASFKEPARVLNRGV